MSTLFHFCQFIFSSQFNYCDFISYSLVEGKITEKKSEARKGDRQTWCLDTK